MTDGGPADQWGTLTEGFQASLPEGPDGVRRFGAGSEQAAVIIGSVFTVLVRKSIGDSPTGEAAREFSAGVARYAQALGHSMSVLALEALVRASYGETRVLRNITDTELETATCVGVWASLQGMDTGRLDELLASVPEHARLWGDSASHLLRSEGRHLWGIKTTR
jgi:hypothetical protein